MKTTLRTLGLAIAVTAIALIGANANVNAASKDAKVSTAAAIQQTDQGQLAQFDSANSTTIAAITNEDTGNAAITNWIRNTGNHEVSTTQNNGTITANTKTGLMKNDTGNVNTGGAFNGTTNTTHTANTGGTAEAGAHYNLAALFGGTGLSAFQRCSWACHA